MTDFDQLIKEKVGQKEYSYSASSWHHFAKKAGLKSALTASQSVIIAVVSVSVISVGSWLGVRYLAPSQDTAPAAEVTVEDFPEPELSVADTLVEVSPEDTMPVSETTTPQPKTSRQKVTSAAAVSDTFSKPKQVREPILRPVNHRRILEINPDTIKSNE